MITLSKKLANEIKQRLKRIAKTTLALSVLVAIQPANAQPAILGNGPGPANGPLSQGVGSGALGTLLGGVRGQVVDGLSLGVNLPGVSPIANNTVSGAVQGGAVQQLNTVIPTISQNLQNISNNQLNGKVMVQDFHKTGKVSMQDFHFTMRRNDKVSMQDFHFVGAKCNMQDFHFVGAKVNMQDFHFVLRQGDKVSMQDFHRNSGDHSVLSDVIVTSVRNGQPEYWMQLED